MISLLVAMDRNYVIGKDNDLPWHLPNDLKFFKETTLHHTIVMGRKTYESIGRPLPKRNNVVLTTNQNFQAEGCKVIHSWDPVLEWNEKNPDEEIFVIGGAQLIKDAIHFANKMYLTEIDEAFDGDTYFPPFSMKDWELVRKEKGIKDEKNPYDYYFCTYLRKM
ncbi:dihydrofolate reductase [Salirhabdus euzebyi]|uniref:Dihydrofolate reductase n=1 Tax=Salirhabdus euzebyi TaxID=394506 RepID=A0A841Q1P8_9BACI|nr:dihydrofolate reductase [Salirhabdus euzebyi]MBB6452273.1 dihydrofolate reductase [Salirhabdus euzebyi]